MAQVMPSIRVTDPQTKDLKISPPQRQGTGRSTKGDGPILNSAKLASKIRSPTSNSAPTTNGANASAQELPLPTQQNGSNGEYMDARRRSEAAIDPLSQQILQRTNTSHTIQKLRPQQAENSAGPSPASPGDGKIDVKQGTEAARDKDGGAGAKADKKKGVSFLSRFIGGNKRKGTLDGSREDGSEAGETRLEGMDAQLFSHTAGNLGFSPKHPQPPAYIKVRCKFKKEKEFDRLFLAQELRSGTEKKDGPGVGANPALQSGSAAKSNPIWALEFSQDGRYLAGGGQDRVVRVWAVIATPEERRAHEKDESGLNASEDATHLSAPVFQQKTFREYNGHTGAILDVSWSKNNFLLSSSMDKTVRLWHITRTENLCTFKHTDFVPSIQFHPRDDRFFLAGSLDTKLRLWSIPDKSVAYWTQLTDMITSVSFTPDGKTCIAGTLGGLCMFYETEGLKYQTQIHVKSTRGQNAKGSKITGIQAAYWPPGSDSGDVKLLISSNDSRLRLYNLRDKSLEMKFRGHENNCSQIRARICDETGHIICGSEDNKAYIWSTSTPEGEKRNQRPVEMFDAHSSITTCAMMAPLKTRQLLSASEDPIYDLCNPPPVTLISRAESVYSSKAPTEADSAQPTPAHTESNFKRAAETPAYLARSAHTDGNIIVTADYTGALKVFRQDCAYQKRVRASDNWDNASVFSKKANSLRPSSILSHRTGRTRRDSTSTQPPNDRIMSWRQDISHGSFDSSNGSTPRRSHGRSASPRKSRMSLSSSIRPTDSPSLGPTQTNESFHTNPSESIATTASLDHHHDHNHNHTESQPSKTYPHHEESSSSQTPDPQRRKNSAFDPSKPTPKPATPTNPREEQLLTNPLSVYNGQSWAFWNTEARRQKLAPGDAQQQRPELLGRVSTVSRLSSELSELSDEAEVAGGKEAGGKERCEHCGGREVVGKGGGWFCAGCGQEREKERARERKGGGR